jgi:hypothetical protein
LSSFITEWRIKVKSWFAQQSTGKERPVYFKDENGEIVQVRPIHPWRWKGIYVWIILFTAAAILFGHILQQQVQDVKNTKASIVSLQSTNCRQRNFLVAAHNARVRSANSETGAIRQADLDAAKSYELLIAGYGPESLGHCKILLLRKVKSR